MNTNESFAAKDEYRSLINTCCLIYKINIYNVNHETVISCKHMTKYANDRYIYKTKLSTQVVLPFSCTDCGCTHSWEFLFYNENLYLSVICYNVLPISIFYALCALSFDQFTCSCNNTAYIYDYLHRAVNLCSITNYSV